MFAFLGVYLLAVSAHKLISQGRGVFLLHTLLSRGMWVPSEALHAHPSASSSAGSGDGAPAPLHHLLLPVGGKEKHSSSNEEGKGGRCGKDEKGRKDGRVLMEEH